MGATFKTTIIDSPAIAAMTNPRAKNVEDDSLFLFMTGIRLIHIINYKVNSKL